MMIGYYGFGVRLFACIFIIGLIILVAVGIIAALRILGRRDARPHSDQAVRILDERYARGEITRDEYRQMKAELGRDSGRICARRVLMRISVIATMLRKQGDERIMLEAKDVKK